MATFIGNGEHNFVYSGDIKFGKSILFEAASWNFPRVETLLVESTYGAKEDIQPTREEVESSFIAAVNNTLAKDRCLYHLSRLHVMVYYHHYLLCPTYSRYGYEHLCPIS